VKGKQSGRKRRKEREREIYSGTEEGERGGKRG